MKDKDLSSDIPAAYTAWLISAFGGVMLVGLFSNGNGSCKVLDHLVSCIGMATRGKRMGIV